MHSQGTPLLLRKCLRLWDIISVKMSISSNTNVKQACQLNLTLLQEKPESQGQNLWKKETTEGRSYRKKKTQPTQAPTFLSTIR